MLRRLAAAVVAALLIFCASPAFSQTINPPKVGTLGAAQQTVTIYPLNAASTCSFVLTGTWVGTVTFEGSSDGGLTWATLTSIGTAGTATADATYVGGCAGYYIARARMSAYTSGTANVSAGSTPAGSGGTGGGGGGSVTQGTSPWIVGGQGTAGAPATAVVTVQGIASGTTLPVNCTSGCSGGAGAPLTGGSTGVATGANQGIAIHAYNGTTLDALKSTTGALNTQVQFSGANIDPRAIRALTSADIVSAAQSGTWNINAITTLPAITQGTSPWVVSGTTGIDQTTPGVTNGVVVNGTLPAFTTTPTFNCGTGCTVPLPIAPHLLTSASTLTCTSINTGSQQLGLLVNANAAAQTVSLVLYDEGASPTCVLADARATITFGQGQFIQTGFIGLSFMNGMAYTLSAAPQAGAPIVIQSTK